MKHVLNIKNSKGLAVAFVLAALLSCLGSLCVGAEITAIATESLNELSETLQSKEASLASDETPDNTASLYAEYSGGDGTQENPYIITTAAHLKRVATNINMGFDVDCCYILGADIDLAGAEWTPIGTYDTTLPDGDPAGYDTTFQGVFDGAGHTISNFKITRSVSFAGLFGYIYNGTVKNLNVKNANIDFTVQNKVNAGALCGKMIIDTTGGITDCSVSDSTINVCTTTYSAYVGGVAGYIMAGGQSGIATVKNVSSSNNDVTGSSNFNYQSNTKSNVNVGGIAGYLACSAKNSATQEVYNGSVVFENCHANTNVTAKHNKTYGSVMTFAGGAVGFTGFGGGAGSLVIKESSAFGNVTARSYEPAHAGGFTGYISGEAATGLNTVAISNCFASVNTYAKVTGNVKDINYTCVGGFSGQTYDSTSKATFANCYASGNAVDGSSPDSYVGAFSGYNVGLKLANCHTTDASVAVGNSILSCTNIIPLSDAVSAEKYVGFDFEGTWLFGDGSYPFPILKNSLVSEEFTVVVLNNGAVVSSTSAISGEGFNKPTDVSLPDSNEAAYTFSHWALIPNGKDAVSFPVTVNRHTGIYAVYDKSVKTYSVNFLVDGVQLVPTASYEYGSFVEFPAAPSKPDDLNFRYSFSHWSLTQGGEAVNQLVFTVSGNHTFHAVYKAHSFGVWDGNTASSFSFGSGSYESPYEIGSGAELYYLSQQLNEGNTALANAHYIVTADIDLAGCEWLPIGTEDTPFAGAFNGGGYKIKGVKLTSASLENAGLFGVVCGAQISKVILPDISIEVNTQGILNSGALIAVVTGDLTTTVSQVGATGKVYSASSGNNASGGLIGTVSDNASLQMTDCYAATSMATVSRSANTYAGGVVGDITTSGKVVLTRVFNTQALTVQAANICYLGGVVGNFASADGLIDNCFSTGTKSAKTTSDISENIYAGHIVAILGEGNSTQNCIYLDSAGIKTQTSAGIVDNITNQGIKAAEGNFKRADLLGNRGYDFENVWEIHTAYSFPTLMIETAYKPIFELTNISKTARAVTASVKVMDDTARVYTITLNVYSNRGRLIATNSTVITNAYKEYSKTLNVSGLSITEPADYVEIIVTDRETLKPLFDRISKKL